MNSLKIKKNDTVVVLSGKDKGKQGKVLGTIPSEAKVVVEGINKVTCHIKPRKQGEEGGITQREAAIYASKVQVVSWPWTGGRTAWTFTGPLPPAMDGP